MTLAERQDAMRVKLRARRNKRLAKQLAKVKAPRPKRVISIRACIVPGDLPTAKLNRMEELAYRIARRNWQKSYSSYR